MKQGHHLKDGGVYFTVHQFFCLDLFAHHKTHKLDKMTDTHML